MTALYPNLCNNEEHYKGTVLLCSILYRKQNSFILISIYWNNHIFSSPEPKAHW